MKILVMTSVYPSPNDRKDVSITPVVHYFTREWVKMGHEVIVIYNANRYPNLFNKLPKRIVNTLMSHFSFVPLVSDKKSNMHYTLEGVKIYRYSMLKIIPRGLFFNTQIKKQAKKIINTLNNENFVPDVIINHWDNPQLQINKLLKEYYNVKSVLVFHGLNNITNRIWGRTLKGYMRDIDIVGYRSISERNHFHAKFGNPGREFVCYSGIPEEFLNNKINNKSFGTKIHKYLFVGSLIERKYPDTIIKALGKFKGRKDFELNIVGEGPMRLELIKLTKELGIDKNVNFLGRVNRDKVQSLMENSECFVMVSKNEVFGLVYLEAMLQGCLVICAKDEGFDGVIKNKKNGFTSKAGDVDSLVDIFEYLDSISSAEKKSVSLAAMKTAEYYTDTQVAIDYLQNVNID